MVPEAYVRLDAAAAAAAAAAARTQVGWALLEG
jgi:hypothetical protein